MLSRAISCFLDQSYPARELVVVYEDDDAATRKYLLDFDEPSVRPIMVASSPKLTLGALRNISIQSSRGFFVAQWDDDDWYAPTRLAEQIKAIRTDDRRGCILARWLIYDEITDTVHLSNRRAWEGSLLIERSAVPPYPELSKGEDTSVIKKLVSDKALVSLDSPYLYVYTYHGKNTWDRDHWDMNILPFVNPLPPETQDRVKSVLRRKL